MRTEDDTETLTVRLSREQREWLRQTAANTGESEDILVAQAIQILRRLSTYRDAGRRFAGRFARRP